MRQRGSIRQHTDWLSVTLVIFLIIAGWLNIYAASYNETHPSPFDQSMEYGKQFVWVVISVIFALAIMNVEGSFFSAFALPFYGLVLVLLILVLLIGKEVNGAKAWFGIGSFGIQPSEFSKVAISLLIARVLSEPGTKIKSIKTRLTVLGIAGIPAALILLQPDTGTVLVFVAFIFALYREGLSGNILLIGFGAVVLAVIAILLSYSQIEYPFLGLKSGIPLLLILFGVVGVLILLFIKSFVLPRFRKKAYTVAILSIAAAIAYAGSINIALDKVLKPHHKKRIEILLGLDEDPQGAGYNVKQSKTAIGSGGFSGKGYLKGPVTKYGFVPEQSTDFIFCTVGEEWGFIGSAVVLVVFAILIMRIMILAERQRSPFARIYGYCAASILFFHVLINVGMVLGLAPVIGIPLPFFSYGGSALLGFTMLIMIMLRFDAERLTVLR